MSAEDVKAEAKLIEERPAALLVQQGEKRVWLPRSQVTHLMRQKIEGEDFATLKKIC